MLGDILAKLWLLLIGAGLLAALASYAIHNPGDALFVLALLLFASVTALAIGRIGL